MTAECKLFSSLLHDLVESSAFALLNSSAQVDIESIGWDVVPAGVKNQALGMGANLMNGISQVRAATVGGWDIQCNLIQIVSPGKTWCVILAKTFDPISLQKIAREDAGPIYPY
ncbi:hypothetical protein FXB40_29880 [Bradyrhizobium rifense]|uniref:Roadblock/LC7 domain-containing protein n=1 Tax=Bradyrhizobium rifense TaxID=515499 RepID=A0A5D3KAM5_9BRAD|nr:hypothetical protein [Bradyrhizobium rifense]TYL90842.1 hypothetical protein FXB40_29880 [Bradyrhizobium rifense]